MRRVMVFILLPLSISACLGSPARWAEDLEASVKCGMSIQEVERLAGRDIRPYDIKQRDGFTHMIRSNDAATDVRLEFSDNRLLSIQILWAEKMMKMASYQRRYLCTEGIVLEPERLEPGSVGLSRGRTRPTD